MVTVAYPDYRVTKPVRALGDFFAVSLDTLVMMFRPPFPWREYLDQTWFVARVSLVPALVMVIPWSLTTSSILNFVFANLGAADYSGAGDSLIIVTEMMPNNNVFVVSGAAGTAICADLGARTIREEVDALRVMGVNPIKVLAVPRVAASTTVTFLLAGPATIVALTSTFFFAVFVQHVSPGAFVDHLTLLVGARMFLVETIKSTLFGAVGGFIACYMGMTAKGGPAGVGRAVSETVAFCFMGLLITNATIDAITLPLLLI